MYIEVGISFSASSSSSVSRTNMHCPCLGTSTAWWPWIEVGGGFPFGTPERALVVDRNFGVGGLCSQPLEAGDRRAPCCCGLLCLETLSPLQTFSKKRRRARIALPSPRAEIDASSLTRSRAAGMFLFRENVQAALPQTWPRSPSGLPNSRATTHYREEFLLQKSLFGELNPPLPLGRDR